MSHFHEIDQYLHGELSEQERTTFERRLQLEPDLQRALEAQQKMELTLQEISREQVINEVSNKHRIIRRKRRNFLLVTASFLILFLVYLRFQQDLSSTPPKSDLSSVSPEIKDLVTNLYDKYNTLANQASSMDPLLKIASKIPFEPQRALQLLESFSGDNKKYDYYYAHARFKTGDYVAARQAFARFGAVITESDPLFQDYQFFNLLNTILLEESSTYQVQLEALLDQEGHEYRAALVELSEGLAELEG